MIFRGFYMKIVEDYAQRVAQRKVDEKLKERNEEIVRNMDEKGVKMEDIAILTMFLLNLLKIHCLNSFVFNLATVKILQGNFKLFL